jgi:hypothetical protein
MPLLHVNTQKNDDTIQELGGKVLEVATLDWADIESINNFVRSQQNKNRKIDFLIMADSVFNSRVFELLPMRLTYCSRQLPH